MSVDQCREAVTDPMSLTAGVEVTEIPTFFGPAEAPLFGVVHVPADRAVRGAVLICGSLGKDHTDSIRALRLMADELATRGIMTMRFDYLGCGDSSFDQLRSDSLRLWQDSIGHALRYVSDLGVTDISAVAIRAGGLILNDYLRGSAAIRRVVYYDPVGTGQRYLREQTAFFKLAAGEDDVPPGVRSMIGCRLAPEAAADFGALKLDPDAEPGVVARLVISRSEGYDGRIKAVVEDPRTDTVLVDDLAQCAQPSRLLVAVSLSAIDSTVAWLDSRVGSEQTRIEVPVRTSARIPVGDQPKSFVVERIERIEPHGMFAIRAMPDAAFDDTPTAPTVVFFTNANNSHHGPGREWVETARLAAKQGHTAIRWDRRGAGESVRARRNEAVYVYSDRGLEDAIAATKYAKRSASRLMLIGVCSGSWYAASAAAELGADAVVLVNSLLWSWRIKKVLRGRTLPGDNDTIDWEQTPRARVRRHIQNLLPGVCWRLIGRSGVVQAPDVVLSSLAKRGVATTVLLCPDDMKLFLANKGMEALRRLRRHPTPPVLVQVPDGDHSAHHQTVLAASREAVLGF